MLTIEPTKREGAIKPYDIKQHGEVVGAAGYNHFYYWADGNRGAWLGKVGRDYPLVAATLAELIEQLNEEYGNGNK